MKFLSSVYAALLSTLIVFSLVACGGGSGGGGTVNVAPVAVAGADQAVASNSPVSLSGAASSDADSDSLTFRWQQSAGPAVALQGSDSVIARFTAPAVSQPTQLTFQLTVSDGNDSAADDVVVRISPPDGDNDGVPDAVDNCPSNANSDQADGDNDGSGDVCDMQVGSRPVANAGAARTATSGETVSLDGSGSTDAEGAVQYAWQQLAGGPRVTLQQANSATPGFTAPSVTAATDLRFELTVTDSDTNTDSDTTTVTVSPPDSDNDGVANDADNCPNDSNPDQADLDNDGVGDACDPTDDRSIGTLMMNDVRLAQTHVLPPAGKSWELNSGVVQNFHMVGDRAALALFGITPNGGRNLLLEGRVGATDLGRVPVVTNDQLPPSEDDGPRYSTTAQAADLPAAWLQPGLEIRLVADNATASAWQAVSVGAAVDFEILSLPFYLFGANEALVGGNPAMPSVAKINEMFAKWPVTDMDVVNHPAGAANFPTLVIPPRRGNPAYVMDSAEDSPGDGFAPIAAVLNLSKRLQVADGNRDIGVQYYGAIVQANEGGSFAGVVGGLGFIGGHVGAGDHTYTGIFIHEQGHAFGMPHAGENFAAGGDYPYVGGSLSGSAWGFDQVDDEFHPVIVPTSASRFPNCANNNFGGTPRQLDEEGRCIRQDPMQSGSGDQAADDSYTLFADFNGGLIQRYFEGVAIVDSNGNRTFSGGRVFASNDFPSGYERWDSFARQWREFDPTDDEEKGRFGANSGFPAATDVSVYTIMFTRSNANTAGATQIYPVIGPYTGSHQLHFDANVAQDRADITPNVSKYPWFCRQRGCDFTLRVTHGTVVKDYMLNVGFRPFFDQEAPSPANKTDATSGGSFLEWAINVPNLGPITKVELLDTPKVWEGLPASPTVLATRSVSP